MKSLLILCLSILILFLSSSPIHADWEVFPGTDVVTLRGLEHIIKTFLNIATALAGLAFLIMILASGFKLLSAWGNPKSVEEAQAGLTKAFLGLFLLIAAWFIIRFIGEFTGLKELLTTFTLQIGPTN